MNIVTYTRVSTDEQNLDAQKIELDEYITRNKMRVVGGFSDVISGAKAARPGLDALVAAIRNQGDGENRIEAVLVVKLDRLGRSLINVCRLIEELDDLGVAIICTSQGIDTRKDSPCGRMIYQVLAVVSEFERNLIRERTKAGLVLARQRGKVLGKPSAKLPAPDEQKKIVTQWIKDGGEDFAKLAKMLGGVATSTAWRIWKKVTIQRGGQRVMPEEVEVE